MFSLKNHILVTNQVKSDQDLHFAKNTYRKDSELSTTQIHSTQPFFMTPNMSTCDSNVLDTRNLYLRQNPVFCKNTKISKFCRFTTPLMLMVDSVSKVNVFP